MEKAFIVVIDDEESILSTFRTFLQNDGYEVATASSFEGGMKLISEREPDVILTDIVLGARSGIDLLREVKNANVVVPVVMITGAPDLSTVTDSLRLGAFDYLSKPVKKHKLLEVTFRALRQRQLLEERRLLAEEHELVRKQLQAVFDGVGDGLILIDENLTVLEINRAALSMLKKAREDAVGQTLAELIPKLDTEMHEDIKAVISGESDQAKATVVDLLGRGGHDVVFVRISPSWSGEKIPPGAAVVLRDITRIRSLEASVLERSGLHNLTGKSKPMQEIYHLVEMLRGTDATVLIQGESGTGKELVARALHYQGPRVKGSFVPVNCTALNDQLLESELFGHVKGAFTGAIANKVGRFEAANLGTIFLDEIGDMSPKLQTKLLRVLQERTIERVGESLLRKVDVRVIAATNRDLDAMIKNGGFREDLFYRLNVIRVIMPALREKKEDIIPLIEHFRRKLTARYKKPIEGFSDDAVQQLLKHDWPGNVRELENAVEHAFIMSGGPIIESDHLPKSVYLKASELEAIEGVDVKDQIKRANLIAALEKADGNRSKAARALGINRSTLYRRMRRLDINY